MIRTNKKKKIMLGVVCALIAVYLIALFGCYFFEPSTFNYADLSLADAAFDMYGIFDKSLNNTFYLKQIDENNIVALEKDNRLKFIDGTIILVAENDAEYSEIEDLISSIDGSICGYIECSDFYQIEFNSASYEELVNICQKLSENKSVITAIPDYFEETPASGSPANSFLDDYTEITSDDNTENENDNISALELINAYEAWDYSDYFNSVNVGIIDGVVDYTNSDIEIVNADDYSVDAFYTDEYLSSINHGTHVAGIIGAEQNNNFGIDGMCSTAEIYSYNGINNSISYWIASLCRMIHYENVKAINVSMGCNTFLIISASMGDEFALNYYDNICGVFEAVLEKLIDSGDEFVIVQAAGNSAYSSQYKVFFECFGYGNKKILSRLDLLGLLDTKTGVADAKYVFYFSNIENEKVRERIIVVGSVNNYGEYSIFSNTGEAVDIAAPGEEIYSSVTYNSFELMSGTSMAAPFVTGTAAMLFALDDTLTGAEVKEILTSTYSETVSINEFTYPILNAGNAVSYVYDLISAS